MRNYTIFSKLCIGNKIPYFLVSRKCVNTCGEYGEGVETIKAMAEILKKDGVPIELDTIYLDKAERDEIRKKIHDRIKNRKNRNKFNEKRE